MDARGWNGEPDAQDDALEHDGHLRFSRQQGFEASCRALVQWIRTASDPAIPLYAPYRSDAQQNAVWYARHCVREARALGLLTEEEKHDDNYTRGRTHADSGRQDLARRIHSSLVTRNSRGPS